jgi:hypothetical protein
MVCLLQTSLAGNPFQFPKLLLDNDAGDDVSVALDHLLQHPNDDDLMSIAKSTGKELYCDLLPPERKDKINKMVSEVVLLLLPNCLSLWKLF